MKKYFIIAAAAMATLVACTKTEVNDTPDRAIAFQVANYVPQTKAASIFDIDKTFTTYAWYHPQTGDAQAFMTNETIKFQSNNTWASDRTYYWPKTGTVNFYSYSGLPAPVLSDADKTATYGSSESPKTIGITDDALLAQPALRYGAANWDANVYSGLNYNSTDVKGVPTLFHHMLAKVSFIVKFDATEVTDEKNKWELVINSASLNYANTGYITVTFAEPSGTAAAQAAWPFGTTAVNWTAGTPNADLDATVTASLGDTGKQTVLGGSASEGKTIFNEISVLPQTLGTGEGATNAKLSLNYTLRHFYKTGDDFTPGIVETINLSDTGTDHLGAIALTAFTGAAVPAWNMNYKYVYTITIKPNKSVTFDPAVEPWVDPVSTGYTFAGN